MKLDWQDIAVADLAAKSPNALATGPFGSAISSKYFEPNGVPVIRGSNLSEALDARLIDDNLVFVNAAKASEFERSIVRRGDLVFTCWGTVGQVGLIDERARYEKYVVSNKQMKLTPDPRVADSLFLYYVFSSPPVSEAIKSQVIGSSVPGFNLTQLRSLRLRLPSIPTQRAIAGVLGALDDKIEQNRQAAQALERLASAIFRTWFVDFEPVKAKAAGATSFPSMPQHVFDALPTRLVDSSIGPVPEGWGVEKLGALIELAYGRPLKAEQRRAGPFPVFGSSGQVGWHDVPLVQESGIIVGRKGSPGAVWISHCAFFPIDTTFFVVRRSDHPVTWLYYLLHQMQLATLTSDTAVPGLNRNAAHAAKLPLPPAHALRAFENVVAALWEARNSAESESVKLTALRDYLLPKLLTGQLTVHAAETIAA